MSMDRDEQIRSEVIKELKNEHKVSRPDAIQVLVKGGIVTLGGSVDNYIDQLEAENAAERVPGVEGVVQNIEVMLPAKSKRHDHEIAQDAVTALDLNSAIPRGRVKVVVENGWALLDGDVDWPHQKDEIESTVSKISGVRGVTSNITVKLPVDALDIKKQIERAFQVMVMYHARDIMVDVREGKVILSGTVRAWVEKVEAERVAREAPGVSAVENRLVLTPLLEGKEPVPANP